MKNIENQRINFRPDIEGLRGLAVAFVVLFHFNLFGVSGGFIGVDVFFVLSGFLMTQIVLGQFDWSLRGIGRFYRKRFWRIAPAYYVVLVAIAIAIAILFIRYPSEFLLYDFPKSLIYAALFSYNIHAPSGAGYFDVAAIEKPILHLWSLGVEVQFYLLWPVMLFAVRKKSAFYKLLAIGAIMLISFISAVILSHPDPDVTYFSILTRLWQFGVGGIVAVLLQQKAFKQASLSSNAVSALSILILVACALYAPEAGWPSFTAVIPTVATAVLLWHGAAGSKVIEYSLELRPLRALGRISYSLYLVHWPVIVLMLIMDPMKESMFVRYHMGIAVSLVLACLLYLLVEKPFRICGKQAVQAQKKWLSAATALTVLVSLVVANNNKLLGIFIPAHVLEMTLQLHQDLVYEEDYCLNFSVSRWAFTCDVGYKQTEPTLFVWGDSHARVISIGMSEEFENAKLRAFILETPGCPPYLFEHKDPQNKCAHYNRQTISQYLAMTPDAKTVVLASRWFSTLNNKSPEVRDKDVAPLMRISNLPAEVAYLEESIQFLGDLGKKVIIATQPPEAASSQRIKPCRTLFLYRGWDISEPACKFNAMDHLDRQFQLDQILKMVADKYDFVELADLKSVFCEGQSCRIAGVDGFYYNDKDHLSVAGASKVVRRFFLTKH